MLRYTNRLFGRAKIQKVISRVESRAHKYYADRLWHLKQGDGFAWEQFVAECSVHLYSYLRYNTACEEDAQRVLSDTMLAIVHEIPTLDEKVTLTTFIYQLAYRKVVDYWYTYGKPDTQTRFGRIYLMANAMDAAKLWPQLEEYALQVLLLHYQASLSINEIADVLDRSYEAIETVLAQLHQQFRMLFFSKAGV